MLNDLNFGLFLEQQKQKQKTQAKDPNNNRVNKKNGSHNDGGGDFHKANRL